MEPLFEDDESVGSASFPTDGCDDDRDGRGERTVPRHQPPTRLPGYCLGESSRNSWDMQIPADALRLHDYAFVRHSDGVWTCAFPLRPPLFVFIEIAEEPLGQYGVRPHPVRVSHEGVVMRPSN